MAATKAEVTLGGVTLAASGSIAWRFQTGTQPYTAAFSVHKSSWKSDLRGQIGKELTLSIKDARGVHTKIEKLTILHRIASNSPNRVSFLVADKRWKWPYKLIARDYNITKRTGDRTSVYEVPYPGTIVVDKYQFKPYSINGDERWTPQDAVEDVLKILEGESGYQIESFPIEGHGEEGQFTIQNIALRDQGDIALGRLLSYIPGAAVYVDAKGVAKVFNAADLTAGEDYAKRLPGATWDGDAAAQIDRKKIRPSEVIVHYQRSVEMLFSYSDDFREKRTVGGEELGEASQNLDPADPYLENVVVTTDPETDVWEFEPSIFGDDDAGRFVTRPVPAGTWVSLSNWLKSMDEDRPEGSLTWTFDTVKRHWLKGDLEGVMGARGIDLDEDGNVAMRVQSLRKHFRQTFRINRNYVEKFRDVQALRSNLLDPISGARAPATVWGQCCIVPTTKGKRMANRFDEELMQVFRNVDQLVPLQRPGTNITTLAPSPQSVSLTDRDMGIFSVGWIMSPYGDEESYIPCHLVGENDDEAPVSIIRWLAHQDGVPMGAGCKIYGGTNGIFLRPKMELKVMLTVLPATPNNVNQFHKVSVSADDISQIFKTTYRIQGGDGPPLEIFVPPGEVTARYQWTDDDEAEKTVKVLMGFEEAEESEEGERRLPDMLGYTLVNENEIVWHSQAFAAEMLSAFSDSLQGRVASAVPRNGFQLQGNMSGASIQVGSAPSAKVNATFEFPGQQKPVSRLALLPSDVRNITLGIVRLDDR